MKETKLVEKIKMKDKKQDTKKGKKETSEREKPDTEISERSKMKISEEIAKKVEEMKAGGNGAVKGANKKKVEKKDEKEYVIPIRAKLVNVQKYRRAGKAIKIIKEFLVRHMKVYDRDLNKIRIDRYLNDFIWLRGIKNPPAKVHVKVWKEGLGSEEVVRVELAETAVPEKLKFKKKKLENREAKAAEAAKKKPKESTKETPQTPTGAESKEKKEEIKEKRAAIVEAGKEQAKTAAKQSKHMTKGGDEPKRQQRKALAK